MLPYATLEPVRELLLQMFMGEKFGRDSIWENHLATELWFTEVPIEVVLDEMQSSLGHVLEWQPGTFLPLSATPNSEVMLRCGSVPMFSAHMGQKSGNIAVKIEGKAEGEA